MPELALFMSKYFASMGKFCLTVYHSYRAGDKRGLRGKRGPREGPGELPPRKPVTAYISYYQDKVPAFQEKYPSIF